MNYWMDEKWMLWMDENEEWKNEWMRNDVMNEWGMK